MRSPLRPSVCWGALRATWPAPATTLNRRGLTGRDTLGPPPEWQQPRLPQDLVRVGVADAGQELLVAEQVLDLVAESPQPLSEYVEAHRADGIGFRPLEVPGRDLQGAIRHPIDPPHVPKVEIAQLLLALDPQREHFGRGHGSVGAGHLKAATEHRIYHEPLRRAATAQLGREHHVLAAPCQRGDATGR